MKKKPQPAIEVEFTITPHNDGTATVTARVLRQAVRTLNFDGEDIAFVSKDGYRVRSVRCLEVGEKTLYLHGEALPDKESASRLFGNLSEAEKAVAAWTKIINECKPPKPLNPIVTVARSGGVA